MHLTLVVPELAAVPDELRASASAFSRFASAASIDGDLDAAIVATTGAPRDTPIAPLAARGAGFDPADAYTLRADPVAFVAGRDDVLLAGRILDLADDEAHALVADLDRHFAADGVRFHAPRADAWFVTASAHVPVVTHPLASIAGPIAPHLPEGDNGRIWRRWLSEMQMILHGSAVNEAREAAGRAPVTGIWISGGGVLPSSLRVDATIYAKPGYRGDVARGLGATADATTFSALRAAPRSLAVTGTVNDASSLAAFVHDWLDPAVAALDRGALASLDVIGDGGGRTLRWTVATSTWWQRLRARMAR